MCNKITRDNKLKKQKKIACMQNKYYYTIFFFQPNIPTYFNHLPSMEFKFAFPFFLRLLLFNLIFNNKWSPY